MWESLVLLVAWMELIFCSMALLGCWAGHCEELGNLGYRLTASAVCLGVVFVRLLHLLSSRSKVGLNTEG